MHDTMTSQWKLARKLDLLLRHHETEDAATQYQNIPQRKEEERLTVSSAAMTPVPDALQRLLRSVDTTLGVSERSSSSLVCSVGQVMHDDYIPAAGDILVPNPQSYPDLARKLYLLVLEADPLAFLAAPFSPYDVPASEDEVMFPGRDEDTRVVQLWNHLHLPLKVAARSWKLDEAATEEANECLLIIRKISVNLAENNQSMITQRGEKIASPDDPRWDYFAEEATLMALLAGYDVKD